MGYIIPTALLPLSRFAIDYLGGVISMDVSSYSKFFFKNNSILVLLSSVMLFVIFLNLKINSLVMKRIIHAFAPLTFGVYLIHNNPTIRDGLWNTLHPYIFMNKWYFLPVGFGIVVGIFVISAFIEWGRKILYDCIIDTKLLPKLFKNKIE